jgi:hypothetical protein
MKNTQKSTQKRLKLYKILTGRTLFACIAVLYLFACVMINVIIRVLPFVPQLTASFSHLMSVQVCNFFDLGLRGFLGIVLTLVFAWDMFIMSCSKLFGKCAWRQHLIGEDPFRFRIEFLIIFALMVFALCGQALSLSATYATSGNYNDPLYLGLQLASEQPRFLYLLCVLASCGGFVVMLMVKKDIKIWYINRPISSHIKVDGYVLMDNTETAELTYDAQNTALFVMLKDPQGYDLFR